MGVASHLGIRIADYDAMIRTFIPQYEEMLDAAASAVATLATRQPQIVDLGTGSAALAERVLAACRGGKVVGIDSDPAMLEMARRRLGRRLRTVTGDFLAVALPRCHAITASFSLHHIRSRHAKSRLYRNCFAALERGGVFINADCFLSSNRTLQSGDRAAWRRHLSQSYGPAGAERHLRAWATEDYYFTLDQERAWLARAGFEVDVVWRHNSFAVIAGTK